MTWYEVVSAFENTKTKNEYSGEHEAMSRKSWESDKDDSKVSKLRLCVVKRIIPGKMKFTCCFAVKLWGIHGGMCKIKLNYLIIRTWMSNQIRMHDLALTRNQKNVFVMFSWWRYIVHGWDRDVSSEESKDSHYQGYLLFPSRHLHFLPGAHHCRVPPPRPSPGVLTQNIGQRCRL